MKRTLLLTVAGAALCIGAFAGCSGTDSPTSASGTGTDALSAAIATAVDAAERDMQAADSLRHGPCGAFGLPLRIPEGCPYDEGNSSFVCGADTDPMGITHERSYQFLDGAGAPQNAYDEA